MIKLDAKCYIILVFCAETWEKDKCISLNRASDALYFTSPFSEVNDRQVRTGHVFLKKKSKLDLY